MNSGYFKKGKTVQKHTYEQKEKVEDVLKYPFVEAVDRRIRKEVCEKFGIRAALSEKDGKTVEAYYFPSYNQKGVLTGFKKQDLTKQKEEDGHWSVIGSVPISNKLSGQEVAEAVKRKHNNVIVTEGQWDMVSTYQSLVDSVANTQYKGMEPFVVSIPHGTANAVEAMIHNDAFVKSFTDLTIFFDNDSCTEKERKRGIVKGEEAMEAVAGSYIGSGINLYYVQADGVCKDASDYLQTDKSSELAKLVQFKRRQYVPEKIIHASDVSLEELIEPMAEGVQVRAFPKLMEKTLGFHKQCLTLITAPSGAGKCHGKGQLIRMHDLSLKKIEDIVVGDKVMGANGEPRSVVGTTSGVDTIYKVTPVKGEPYTVNSKHLLVLESNADVKSRGFKKDGRVTMNAEEFDALPKHYKEHVLSGVFANVSEYYSNNSICEDEAYMLGLWLAEGDTTSPKVTLNKKDVPLHDFLKTYAEKNNYSLNVYSSDDRIGCTTYSIVYGDTKFISKLKLYGVVGYKHIPEMFLKSDLKTRLNLLAGFIDGDGYTFHNTIEMILKDNKLAEDIVLLAQLCGLRCTVKDKFSKCQNFEGDIYKRISVFGNTNIIPCKLPRKKTNRFPNKNQMRTGISVKDIGVGEYFGIEVDGDNLYCLPDFQITHNTSCASVVANAIFEQGFKPGLIYLEETAKETVQRMIASELKVNYLKFKRNPLNYASIEAITAAREKVIAKNPALLDHFGSIAIPTLMSKVRYMHEVERCSYIILDHISMTISGLDVGDERKELDMAITELAAYCASHDVGIIVICHLNRAGTADQFKAKKGEEDKPYWVRVTKESLRGSASLEQLSFVILGLEPEILPNRERGRTRWVVLKNRPAGYLGEADVFTLDPVTWEVVLSDLEDF